MLEKEPLFEVSYVNAMIKHPKGNPKNGKGINMIKKERKEVRCDARRIGKKDDRREEGRCSSSQKIASLTQRR